MKKFLSLQQVMLYLSMVFVATTMLTSCGSDDEKDPPPPPPKLEGFYVFGTNTVASLATDAEARMALALLDPSKDPGIVNKDGVYGQYMYIGSNSTISFIQVDAEQKATEFGAEDGGTVTLGTDIGNVPINDLVIHGALKKNGPKIKVEDEGLYYTWVDTNNGIFSIVPVKAQMIGDATKLMWAAGTPLPMISTSKEKTVFEGTNIDLKGATGYRYRINDGWHASDAPGQVTLSSLGVESYGEAWDSGINDVGFFLDNIPHKENGVFTVRLEYDAANDEWTETKTKTGDLLIDYSDKEMSIFGNAYTLPGGAEGNWGSGTDGYGLHTPIKEGNVYTWMWNDVTLIAEREFIFLEDGTWGGVQVDFLGAANGGAAITNGDIKDATTADKEFHNYYVVTGAVYDVTLVIDAAANTKTVTIVKN
jgi:hypothetical protein